MKSAHYKISLRIQHPSLDLEPISLAIGLKVERIWKAGDERKTPTGKALGGYYDRSYCMINMDSAPNDSLNGSIDHALSTLKANEGDLVEITESGGRVSFFVGWFSPTASGATLESATLAKMVRLNMHIDLNIYCGEPEEGD